MKMTLSHKQVDFSLKGTTNFYFNLKTQFEKIALVILAFEKIFNNEYIETEIRSLQL
jgi:hypothetical protein